jgi:hypothetical protein
LAITVLVPVAAPLANVTLVPLSVPPPFETHSNVPPWLVTVNTRFPPFKHTSAGLGIFGATGNAFSDIVIGVPFTVVIAVSQSPPDAATMAV